jgi:hypothetical protein
VTPLCSRHSAIRSWEEKKFGRKVFSRADARLQSIKLVVHTFSFLIVIPAKAGIQVFSPSHESGYPLSRV